MENFFTSTVTLSGRNSVKIISAISVAELLDEFPAPAARQILSAVERRRNNQSCPLHPVAYRRGGKIVIHVHRHQQALWLGALFVRHADAAKNFKIND